MKNAVEIFNKYAQKYFDNNSSLTEFLPALKTFCSNFEGGRLLDIACGPGQYSAYMIERYPDAEILAIDPAQEMLTIGQVAYPNVQFKLAGIEYLQDLQTSYSGMICSFLIPYLTFLEVEQLISDIYAGLDQGGALYISTMIRADRATVVETNSEGDQLDMLYLSPHDLPHMLEAANFEILSNQECNVEGYEVKTQRDQVIVAKRK